MFSLDNIKSPLKMPFTYDYGPVKSGVACAPNRSMWYSHTTLGTVGSPALFDRLQNVQDGKGNYVLTGTGTALNPSDPDARFYMKKEQLEYVVTNMAKAPCIVEIYEFSPRRDMQLIDREDSMVDSHHNGESGANQAEVTLSYVLRKTEPQWLIDLFFGFRRTMPEENLGRVDMRENTYQTVQLFPLNADEMSVVEDVSGFVTDRLLGSGTPGSLIRDNDVELVQGAYTATPFQAKEFQCKYKINQSRQVRLQPGESVIVKMSHNWNRSVKWNDAMGHHKEELYGREARMMLVGVKGVLGIDYDGTLKVDANLSSGTAVETPEIGSLGCFISVSAFKKVTGYSQESDKYNMYVENPGPTGSAFVTGFTSEKEVGSGATAEADMDAYAIPTADVAYGTVNADQD